MGGDGLSKLAVHSRAIELVVDVYKLTDGFPKHEVFGLTSQLRRAVVSVPANIAEGRARLHQREFLHHLSIARGSLAEVGTLLTIAARLGYAEAASTASLRAAHEEVGNMLGGLIRSVSGDDRPLHGR